MKRKLVFRFTPIIFLMILAMSYGMWGIGVPLLVLVLGLVRVEILEVIEEEEKKWGWRAVNSPE